MANSVIRQHEPVLGGPKTVLPFVIESFLSWALCTSCLSVSGYHYVLSTILTPKIIKLRKALRNFLQFSFAKNRLVESANKSKSTGAVDLLEYWIPLTITSQGEIDRATVRQRHDQLILLLRELGASLLDEHDLVRIIRSNEPCRRLSTLVMRPYESLSQAFSESKLSSGNGTFLITNILLDAPELDLPQKLARIWPKLLLLPMMKNDDDTEKYLISMIVPAYREEGGVVVNKLKKAMEYATDSSKIQVIIVDAGKCVNLEDQVRKFQNLNRFGNVQLIKFSSGGGRGPCLNFGAEAANGQYLTFCHSDTTLPLAWDSKIVSALLRTSSHHIDSPLVTSCAFSFGIDTSFEGLTAGNANGEYYYPPGIKAVETTANLRTHMYSLPYGDQVISIPSHIFHYIGGFPDQCLMEDYELVGLLRKRAALLPKFLNQSNIQKETSLESDPSMYPRKEKLGIIGGDPALCSPRRWQKFGVLYVTFMNSKFVNLYASGLGPDGLFRLYYGTEPPTRKNKQSPWEVEQELSM